MTVTTIIGAQRLAPASFGAKGLWHAALAFAQRCERHRERRSALDGLRGLSEREIADIGLTRAMITLAALDQRSGAAAPDRNLGRQG